MTETKSPPKIFNPDATQAFQLRAERRSESFIEVRCAIDAAERVCDINRTFKRALILGSKDFFETITRNLPALKSPEHMLHMAPARVLAELGTGDTETTPHKEFDLIICGLFLHSVNDLPGCLIQLRRALSPDGLFMSAMFGGETLTELRQACYEADEKIFGGIMPRIFPFADYSQSAALLQRTGFALPVIDTDRFRVNYEKLETLIHDIRDMGEQNTLEARQPRGLTHTYWEALKAAYAKLFLNDGKFLATFEIIWMTGWSPHESQQKPLKPGSARMRLADALGVKENSYDPKSEAFKTR